MSQTSWHPDMRGAMYKNSCHFHMVKTKV
uniref:Uncharacterized protein n=1 Tax=Anguilla anguilla TaxID=7936 RepID=A0A0E9UD98_ANGAN